jgi:YVTN family beta-propeller protein
MAAQHTMPAWQRWLEKNWLLIPLGLIAVMVVAALETFALNAPVSIPDLPLQRVTDIPLAGGTTRFDYQSLDPRTRLLFIAHSGADMVTVFNTASKRVVANIPGIFHVHGVLAVAQLGRVYATDSDGNQVYVIDEHTEDVITKIPVGDGPDGLAYDPITRQVFVSEETGQNEAVIDARSNKLVTTIPLGGEAGNTQYDTVSQRIFVDVQTLDQLVVLDPAVASVVARYPLPGCNHDHGLNIDSPQRLAFIACDGNATLLMMDMRSMKVIAEQSVGANPDVLALDSSRHYLYVACESGVVSVFDEHGQTLQKAGEGFVAVGAHSVAVDQQTHYLYLPLEDIDNQPVLRVALYAPSG